MPKTTNVGCRLTEQQIEAADFLANHFGKTRSGAVSGTFVPPHGESLVLFMDFLLRGGRLDPGEPSPTIEDAIASIYARAIRDVAIQSGHTAAELDIHNSRGRLEWFGRLRAAQTNPGAYDAVVRMPSADRLVELGLPPGLAEAVGGKLSLCPRDPRGVVRGKWAECLGGDGSYTDPDFVYGSPPGGPYRGEQIGVFVQPIVLDDLDSDVPA